MSLTSEHVKKRDEWTYLNLSVGAILANSKCIVNEDGVLTEILSVYLGNYLKCFAETYMRIVLLQQLS